MLSRYFFINTLLTVTRAFYLEKDEGDFARTLTWCMAGGTVTNVDVVVDSFWGKFE